MIQPQNPIINKLFKPLHNRQDNLIRKGDLISFNYLMWKNDPSPLIIVTDVIYNNRIRGLNLHYLTFPYIKSVITMASSTPNFSYANIKGDGYIKKSFRNYKWLGIRNIRKLDSKFLMTVMSNVRSFDPQQVQAIRESVQQQINQLSQVKASNMTGNI